MDAIRAAQVLARARTWIRSPRSYSQELNDPQSGYRMDCSGYVSMAWLLDPPGLTTVELPDVSTVIDKEELRAGDVVMNGGPGTSGDVGHVILFDRWADADKTTFWGYEQISTSTTYRVIPYPDSPYLPYRRKNIIFDELE